MHPLTILATLLPLCLALTASLKVPPGFAYANGDHFEIDGKHFAFIGANSYWLPLLTSDDDIEATLTEMQHAGIKVLRTWGFNAINGSELLGATQSGLTYYQLWNSSKWILNDGPHGLQRLDRVVQAAARHNIKLILVFTNNWVGYGGSDLYINWIAGEGQSHDVFFTDPRIIASYQKYVKIIVNRYKANPTIFAWELMNEARCLSDLMPAGCLSSGPGLPSIDSSAGPACLPGSELLTRWYRQQSEFVRSLDPSHMITTGGEGHFYWPDHPVKYWLNGTFISDYNFDGRAGEDFDTELQTLDEISFGTYHMYPQFWYSALDTPGSNFSMRDWGARWIQQHANAAKRAGKPLVLEEFGLSGISNKSSIYPSWVHLALETRHGGIMPWQFGMLGLKENGGNRVIKYADTILDGASPNDGFTVYKNQTTLWNIFTHAANVQASRSG